MKRSSNKSTISETEGVEQPNQLSKTAIEKVLQSRKIQPTSKELIAGILSGNNASLSRAITLIESKNPDHQIKAVEIVNACLPRANQSIRVGITGIPGVGKSTFIEALGSYLTHLGKKVAVLAVDPSSSISQGSILGDKTRMEELVKDKNAFIRPSASGDTLGGVARKTRETITLCEAFGYEIILIETVGVGQSETAVHSMVDFFLLLKITGAGDELQGIKRGIMEMADAIVINKADGDNLRKAQLAKVEFNRALHLFPSKKSGWTPTSFTCSALTHQGIPEIWESITTYIEQVKKSNYFYEKRTEQNQYWLVETIEEHLKLNFYNHPEIKKQLEPTKKAVQMNEISPFAAAQLLLEIYSKK